MNTSKKGSAYENEIIAVAKTNGHHAMRSAASKGVFDIHLWDRAGPLSSKSGYFQCKAGRFSCAAAERLAKTLPWPEGATDVGVIHDCPKGCRWQDHGPRPHCMHFREPPDAV